MRQLAFCLFPAPPCPGSFNKRQSNKLPNCTPHLKIARQSHPHLPPRGSLPMCTPRLFAVVVAGILATSSLSAADAPLPSPGEIKAIEISPSRVSLIGSDAASQVIVTATLNDG